MTDKTGISNHEALETLLIPAGVYAGIGSRETPSDVLRLMEDVAGKLARRGWVLRTGMATGADQAFYRGAGIGGAVDVYLPWAKFEARALELRDKQTVSSEPSRQAYALAKKFHPAWEKLSQGARKLQARNGHQVLGDDLETPADLVVCWTPDGSRDGRGYRSGGTGQALRIAHDHGVPVLNLAREEDREALVAAVLEPLVRTARVPEAEIIDIRDFNVETALRQQSGKTRTTSPTDGLAQEHAPKRMQGRGLWSRYSPSETGIVGNDVIRSRHRSDKDAAYLEGRPGAS